MKMQKLLVSPIVEIKEINEQEEVGLTADEIRLISKAYNTYWKQHESNRPVKRVHQFFWEELERWGKQNGVFFAMKWDFLFKLV